MIGDMFNNNKRKDVKTREDQVMFMGKKYRQDKKTRLLCLHDRGEKEASCDYLGSGAWGSRASRLCHSSFGLV